MVARICWRCSVKSEMRGLDRTSTLKLLMDDGQIRPQGPHERSDEALISAPFACNHCGAVNVGHARFSTNDHRDHYEAMTRGLVSLRWLPNKSSAPTFEDTPPEISAPAREAYTAWDHAAYRAAILMARAVLEAICKDHGVTKGQLFQKIDAMESERHITKSLQKAAHAVRELGNEMAHGDFVKTNPTGEQAKQVLAIMRLFIEQLYEQPAETARLLGEEGASSEA